MCGGIASLAAVLALPVAWSWRMRRPSARSLVLLLAPMALPSYLAYSGWGTVRAPGTWLGDWLASLSPGRENVWPMVAGRVQAVAGLALFLWPLSALVQWLGLAGIDAGVHESLRLEPMRWPRRVVASLAMARGAALGSVALPALVLMGSAVPLHLAQLETPSIGLWRLLDLTAPAEHWRVWMAAWPMLGIAIAGAVWLGRTVCALGEVGSMHPVDRTASGRKGRSGRGAVRAWPMGALLALSFAAPVALQALSLTGVHALGDFLSLNQLALGQSVLVAMAVSGCAAVVGVSAWLAARDGGMPRLVVRGAIVLWLAMALVPGVLVGVAINQAWANGPAWVRDSWLIVVLSHVARFGFVPALVGWWLAISEPPALRDLGLIDGVRSIWGVWRAVMAGRWPVMAVVCAGAGVLSFHEIEATVMVQPPGGESFARTMLQNLHYARDDALAAGVVVVAAAVSGVALLGIVANLRGYSRIA